MCLINNNYIITHNWPMKVSYHGPLILQQISFGLSMYKYLYV